ncbi:MAG: 5-carboxymethyl-2-hydroxymuconate Delta-isomerase [Paracoccaceae bacterium]
MPHFCIEYSANMENRVDIQSLCDLLRHTAIDTGVFPLAGVRVRAFRADHVSIADGDTQHGFIDISIRLRAGRDLETRKRATDTIFGAAEAFLAVALTKHSFALSLEMRDIDPELSPKTGSIRQFLKEADPS